MPERYCTVKPANGSLPESQPRLIKKTRKVPVWAERLRVRKSTGIIK